MALNPNRVIPAGATIYKDEQGRWFAHNSHGEKTYLDVTYTPEGQLEFGVPYYGLKEIPNVTTAADEKIERLEGQVKTLRDIADSQHRRINNLEAEVKRLTADNGGFYKRFEKLEAEVKTLTTRLENDERDICKNRENLRDLVERLVREDAIKSTGEVVREKVKIEDVPIIHTIDDRSLFIDEMRRLIKEEMKSTKNRNGINAIDAVIVDTTNKVLGSLLQKVETMLGDDPILVSRKEVK